jgi:signal transduction histidine kinase
VRRDGDVVTVRVDDDGVGGARIGAGSGLRGLQDRLAALDGTLAVDSRHGDGTRLLARIPCGADALVAEARNDAGAPPPGPPAPPAGPSGDRPRVPAEHRP